jgi:hypothetical protein
MERCTPSNRWWSPRRSKAAARPPRVRAKPALVASLAVLVAWTAVPPAAAQRIIHPRDVNYLDPYGNARRLWRDPLWFAFENDAQRALWQTYQSSRFSADRASQQRISASLPGAGRQFLAETALGRLLGQYEAESGYRARDLPRPIRQAEKYYGGFDDHRGARERQPLGNVLRRRASMLSAIGLRAPLLRSMRETSERPTLPGSVQRTPFMPTDVDDTTDPTVSLGEKMADRISALHKRARDEAWALFEAGEYRLAARAFDSSTTLAPNDFDARVGEIFCALSTGSIRTAVVILQSVIRREVNPFAHQLNVADRYGSGASASSLRTRLQQIAQQSEGNADVLAIQVFGTWYLGYREEAATIATSLAGLDPGSRYARWPELMSEARTALEADEQQSEP